MALFMCAQRGAGGSGSLRPRGARTGVAHAAACRRAVGGAAGGRRQHHAIRLDLQREHSAEVR